LTGGLWMTDYLMHFGDWNRWNSNQ